MLKYLVFGFAIVQLGRAQYCQDPNEYYVAPNQYPNGGGGGFPAVAVAASITSPRSPSQGDFRQYDTDGSASTFYGYQQFCYGYRPGSLVSCGKSCDCNDYPYCNQYPQTCCDRGICICRPGYWRLNYQCVYGYQCPNAQAGGGPVPAVAAIGQPIVASGGRPTFPRRPQHGRWRSELNEMDSKRPISAKNQIDEEKKQIFEKADLEPLNLKLKRDAETKSSDKKETKKVEKLEENKIDKELTNKTRPNDLVHNVLRHA